MTLSRASLTYMSQPRKEHAKDMTREIKRVTRDVFSSTVNFLYRGALSVLRNKAEHDEEIQWKISPFHFSDLEIFCRGGRRNHVSLSIFSHVYMLFYFCISQENLESSRLVVLLGIFASEVTTTACRPRFSIQEFIAIFSYIYKLQHADKKSWILKSHPREFPSIE